jgi:serine/threonine protein kinase
VQHSYNEKEARDVLRTVLDALVYCHERGIVHRDLKVTQPCRSDGPLYNRIRLDDGPKHA